VGGSRLAKHVQRTDALTPRADVFDHESEAEQDAPEAEPANSDAAKGRGEKHERRMQFIRGHRQREREGRIRERIPFTKVVAVFNSKNLCTLCAGPVR
jgi:hypothetical protein